MSKLLKSLAILGAVVGTVFATTVEAATILIKDAKVHTMTSAGTLENADILIEDGLIRNIGDDLSASGAKVIDAKGKVVTSGIFALSNQIGLVEISAIEGTNDTSTQAEGLGASLRVDGVFNAKSTLIPVNRSGGVTRTLIAPYNGSSLFAGLGAIMDLSGDYDSLILSDVAIFATYGEHAAGMSGGSRASALHRFNTAFEQAREYAENKDAIKAGEYHELDYSIGDLEALNKVLDKEIPLVVGVNRASDILAMIKLAKKYDISLVLSGVAEGWKVAEQIAQAEIPVMVDPMDNIPSSFESLGKRYDNAALLNKAGVDVMLLGQGFQATHNAHTVRQSAGNAVAYGLPYDKALAGMTSLPAKVFGGASNYGKLMPGFKAELVVWSGDPFEVTSHADAVILNGEVTDMVTRPDKLSERYKDITTDKNTFYRK